MRRAVTNTLAASTLLLGGAGGYALAESGNGKPPPGTIVCDEAQILGVTAEDKIIYAPVVHTLGNLSLGKMYTRTNIRNFATSDPVTGEIITDTSKPRVSVHPGIYPVEVPLRDQGNVRISIIVTDQDPMGMLPSDAQMVDCPIRDVAVTNN